MAEATIAGNRFIGGDVVNTHIALQEESIGYMSYPDTFRRFFGETENNSEPMITGFGIARYFTKYALILAKVFNHNNISH